MTDGLEEEAQELYETGLALMGRFGGPILEIGAYLRDSGTALRTIASVAFRLPG